MSDDQTDHRDLDVDELNRLRLAGARKRAREAIARGEKATYVNGRKAALATLDYLLSRTGNIQKLYEAMQERLDVDAVGFMREVVMPLTPKTYVESHEAGEEANENSNGDGPKVVIQLPDNGRPRTV